MVTLNLAFGILIYLLQAGIFYNTVGIELPDVTSRLSGKTPLDGVQAYVVQDTVTFSPLKMLCYDTELKSKP